jgi:catechol 2,3-dioxygenase-like lactoylglutathione lyase family enzyme
MSQRPEREPSTSRPRVLAVTPMLVVAELQRALDFYAALGFETRSVHGEPPCFAMMSRDGFDLMLSVARAPSLVHPPGREGVWSVFLVVADVASELSALRAAGVAIDKGPTDTFYAMREIEVLDPDGHRICFAEDISSESWTSTERFEGALDVGSAKLRLVMTLGLEAGCLVGRLDSLDQGAMNLPLDSLARAGSSLCFEMKNIGAQFAGDFSADGRECSGRWSQNGRSWPLLFRRT